MKIALLGAPGAGKSKLARSVTRRLNKGGNRLDWIVIDDYVDRLRKRTGLPFGIESDFAQIFEVITERWKLEEEVQHRGLNSITCGSIYESIVYAAIQLGQIFTSEQELIEDHLYAQTMMQALGVLEHNTFDYHALFLVPASPPGGTWEQVVDAKLPEVLEGFAKYAVPLLGTHKQKVDRATDIIQRILTTSSPAE